MDVGHILLGQQQREKATQQQIFKMPANNSLARVSRNNVKKQVSLAAAFLACRFIAGIDVKLKSKNDAYDTEASKPLSHISITSP